MQESRTRLGIVALLPVLIVIGAAGWAAQGWVRLRSAIDPGGASQVIEIARGEALGDVRARLVGRGLLSPDAPLLLWARVTGEDREIRSGFYEISPAQTPLEILRTFVSGEVLTLSVTLPEGFTREQVFSRLTKQLDMERDSLEAAAADAAFVRSLGVPTDSLEGYLYPETYRFERGPNARHVIAALVAACFERFTDARCRKADSLGMSLHEVLTLASIVQAEAAQEEEMPHIAAVYHNRLSRGWLLQADPTVSYILGRQGQRLWEHHLEVDSPYNTYRYPGLPPGPICSPGLTSIDAVLHPLEGCRDLYFVARGDGTHIFSRSLEAHNRAKEAIRRGR